MRAVVIKKKDVPKSGKKKPFLFVVQVPGWEVKP